MPAGYSGTPLSRKLGLRDGQRVAFIGLPSDLGWLTSAAGFAEVALESGVDGFGPARPLDVIHLFTARRSSLEDGLQDLMNSITPDGMIWVSWPKKASKVVTDVTEDVVRELALPIGLVDVKVCAIDEVWSGLKLMVRRELR
ncbi:DUF3052 family protein [Pleomorphomonas sp. PLEO]|uniref:DUF3052 family protein n=1 Tax=Pleomorphomonas sp. PLEO TaxID=3239306 RepID=UPI00351EC21E